MMSEYINKNNIEQQLDWIFGKRNLQGNIRKNIKKIASFIYKKIEEKISNGIIDETDAEGLLTDLLLQGIGKNYDPKRSLTTYIENFIEKKIKNIHKSSPKPFSPPTKNHEESENTISNVQDEETENSDDLGPPPKDPLEKKRMEIGKRINYWENIHGFTFTNRDEILNMFLKEYKETGEIKHPAYRIMDYFYGRETGQYNSFFEERKHRNQQEQMFIKIENKLKSIYVDFDENLENELKNYLKEEEINYFENKCELQPYEINILYIKIQSFISIYVPPKIKEMIEKIKPTNYYSQILEYDHYSKLLDKFKKGYKLNPDEIHEILSLYKFVAEIHSKINFQKT
jgi:hypothetical protein